MLLLRMYDLYYACPDHAWLCCFAVVFWVLGGAGFLGAQGAVWIAPAFTPVSHLSTSGHSFKEMQEQPVFTRLSHYTSGN